MDRFTKRITVTAQDLDELDHVNNVRYVQWIQDVSKEHWQAKAPEEIKKEVLWVVLTHHIAYKAPATINDPITITTYIKETQGAKSVRVVEMEHSSTKTLLVQATTEWCLLKKENLRPMRVPRTITELFD